MKSYIVDRKVQIKHFTDISAVQEYEYLMPIQIEPLQGEVFVLQVALLSPSTDTVKDITYDGTTEFSCINRDCVDKYGVSYKREIMLEPNVLQPMFFLVENAVKEHATIKFHLDGSQYVIIVDVLPSATTVSNHGYDDLWRLSRLKWLNSSVHIDDNVPSPFVPIAVDGDKVSIIGRDFIIGELGLPKQIVGHFDEGINLSKQDNVLLKQAMTFDIGQALTTKNRGIASQKSRVTVSTFAESSSCEVQSSVVYRYDGMIEGRITLTAKASCKLAKVDLSVGIDKQYAKYINGLGEVGGKYKDVNFKWRSDKHLDSIYIGNVNLGLRLKLMAQDYVRPLINIYYKNQPLKVPTGTWDNHSQGVVTLKELGGEVALCASCGSMDLNSGESKTFVFQLHVTPLKPIDYKKHYATRYSHNNNLREKEIKEVDRAEKKGLNNIIIHHGNMTHPFINYPFIEADRLKNLVKYAEARDIGIKVYYTVREHSNHMAEVFAYKALGDEIILRKKGDGYNWGAGTNKWLTEYFGEKVIPAWMVRYNYGKYKGDPDVSFIVRPDSRLDNYYIEGLDYLVKTVGINGIYIDDTALDRATLERARKAIGGGLIDMHMWNHEEERAGDVSCMNLYTEIFPFVDSLWIGEGYPYKKLSPEYILTEVSGIPYGLTSQMLEGGGDFHIGMLYAMNNRYGWGVRNATKIYTLWDDFGIQDSTMYGYWHSQNPTTTSNNKVLATTYVSHGKALVALYNFGDKTEFSVDFCTKTLGFTPKVVKSAAIKGLQRKRELDAKAIKLKAGSGIILWIE